MIERSQAHVPDKRQLCSNATVSDAILGDLPRLQKRHMRGMRFERKATVPLHLYKTMVRPAMLCGIETLAVTRGAGERDTSSRDDNFKMATGY